MQAATLSTATVLSPSRSTRTLPQCLSMPPPVWMAAVSSHVRTRAWCAFTLSPTVSVAVVDVESTITTDENNNVVIVQPLINEAGEQIVRCISEFSYMS